MFCEKCGNKIEDDAVFCPKCGAKVSNEGNYNNAGAETASQNYAGTPDYSSVIAGSNRGQMNKIIGIAAVAVIAVITLFILLSNRKYTINLNKYVELSYSGYNTVGTATYTFNREKFDKDYGKKIKFTSKGKKELMKELKDEMPWLSSESKSGADITAIMEEFGYTPAQMISETISGSIDNTTGLSNGDKVVFTWDINVKDAEEISKYLNCKLKYSDVKGEVKDLEEAKTFDPFAGITVTFTGVSPDGYADYTNNSTEKAAKNLYYEFDRYSGLSNGDEITLSVSGGYGSDIVKYCAENYGLIPSSLEKTYKVEGLSAYVTAFSELSEDALTKMNNQSQDSIKAYAAQSWNDEVSLESVEYIGSYFLTEKAGTDQSYKNFVNLVYRCKALINIPDADYRNEVTFYYYTQFNNIMKLDDGTISMDLNNYQTPGDSITFDTGVDSGWWSTYTYYFKGFDNIDTMFNKLVTQNVDRYTYESTVAE